MQITRNKNVFVVYLIGVSFARHGDVKVRCVFEEFFMAGMKENGEWLL